MSKVERMSAANWVDVAYERFRSDGLAGVRVEAIARDLGATKGSFYWHFSDRRALVDAVLERWGYEETDRFIAEADAAGEPRERLRVLFDGVSRRRISGEDTLYVDAEREGVVPIVAAVTEKRVAYVADAITELGIEPDEARRRAIAAVAVVLGLEQLRRGGATRGFASREELIESLMATMLRV